ncbi:MAG: CHAT domain-containing protein, partial [Planctomycetes bacterium]|nr:CHAT domain-containing protein [Planctomycetota bacterium]
MAADRSVKFEKDAHGNVVVTGDNNHVYVFSAPPPEEVLRALETGKLKPEDVPEAVPQPTLTLRISFADEKRESWTVTVTSSPTREHAVPVPWKTEGNFGFFLETFWKLTADAIQSDDQRGSLYAAAVALGAALRNVLTEADANLLIARARGDGPPPFLVIESDDDLILALPWELIRLEDDWTVRNGRLDIARTVPAEGAPHLEPPTHPVSLLVNVSAPAGSGLNYEVESYHVTRALHDHVGVRVNEMGELDDLVRGLAGDDPPTGVHFSGHGGHGTLTFEDEFGKERQVPVEELLTEINQAAPNRKPRFFYLACCHGNTPPSLHEKDPKKTGNVSSTAAQLHRGGVAQIVAHFGPVYDALSTNAETAFYREIAKGRRTRDAVRAARTAMALPYHPTAREVQREVDGGDPDGVSPFAWAQLVFYHRGPDYPLGLEITRKYADAVRAQVARRVEDAFPGARTQVLRAGFIGRRTELHALRRDLKEDKHIH